MKLQPLGKIFLKSRKSDYSSTSQILKILSIWQTNSKTCPASNFSLWRDTHHKFFEISDQRVSN